MRSESSTEIRIVLVSGRPLFRAGLHLLIDEQESMRLVGEAGTIEKALEVVARMKPDIVLLDMDAGSEDILSLLSRIRSNGNGVRVIVLSEKLDSELSMNAIRAGAKGHVLKEAEPLALFKAIHKVHAGEVWLDRSVMADVIDQIANPPQNGINSREKSPIELLTERELEVMRLVCEGLRNKQIALRLHISESTVRHHLSSIFDKLDLSERFQLVLHAFRHRLVQP